MRQLAGAAMQAQRLFRARARQCAGVLRPCAGAPAGASAQASQLVDLQPQLVIAVERRRSPRDAIRKRSACWSLLQQVDAGAPALQRLRESVASAEATARDLELAMDAESKARALQAEVELRRQAKDNAAKLASARNLAHACGTSRRGDTCYTHAS
ncbi:hypothetical protein [Thermomonas sp.]|uniref:hypothetical protein n=1 Tax=Thermomonas sp. TaxID=1971895 RepID=UPI001ECA95D0|nr:hypothetical protein [Thermomonas sp.]MBK6415637.1 hypothetical protein [Thermomonas sp.]